MGIHPRLTDPVRNVSAGEAELAYGAVKVRT